MTTRPDFARFPVYSLLEGPTPIQRLDRLSDRLGINLFVKRDDLIGLGMGGNKLRKLEFLVGDAIAQRADTIVTVGARQSNHARLTAAAAAKAGLRCELVLTRAVPRTDDAYLDNGNTLLNELLGAVVHDLPGTANALEFAEARAQQLRDEGRNVYVCPLGGSSPTGCIGYAKCAIEIRQQEHAANVRFDEIVVPNGSGGTHAGLVAGFASLGAKPALIRAHAVYSNAERSCEVTLDKINRTLPLLQSSLSLSADDLNLSDQQLGDGYGIPTDAMRAAVKTLAATEGLFIDPVYGGKAFAGLLHDVEAGRYARGQNVLFVMTGGLPGLFAYRSAF
ncbi:D-cysteine desulfhydrase family protein [Paraburkholderia caballeronis]|uniref:D-cysteine desulfhydrase family protein n=1 Tax=Paraburkholderia caballeronis TaxID=416943 RepID=UPI0010655EF1|nr:D-cysteine desulfhydrase family protein [Paraburkholderia caballeronis]TDV19367.1 D-cysteine desulfhydrase [Paraburkholderia caballeronis]TDV21967.1 D-cysteine desulfhydrase [Paraburkholderia caballeronis]TDV28870.1 D-cysteine desulfhydrase [Paraburkholderia caballeronis]